MSIKKKKVIFYKLDLRTRPQTSTLISKFNVPMISESKKIIKEKENLNHSCSSSNESEESDWIQKGKQINFSEEKCIFYYLN